MKNNLTSSKAVQRVQCNQLRKFVTVFLLLFVSVLSIHAVGIYDVFGYGASATGGGSATPILVDTYAEFETALSGSESDRVVIITKNCTIPNQITSKGNNITILGLPGVRLVSTSQSSSQSGILNMRGKNIIIRNLIFEGPGAYDADGKDLLQFEGATNAWVDHCEFQDGMDGNFDIKGTSDNITITWCRFRYLKEPKAGGSGGSDDHRYSNLLGASDSNKPSDGTYNITYAYNWWDEGCVERMVRCRNASLHFINCYWNSSVAKCYFGPYNTDCYLEGCYMEEVNKDRVFYENYDGTNGIKYNDCYYAGGSLSPVTDRTVKTHSYEKPTLLSYSEAKTQVTSICGAGATLAVETDGTNVTITPCGTSLTQYTVTFNLNDKGTNFTQDVYENSKVTEPTAPTASGYVFDGWYKEASCTNAFDFSTAITGNITLYAKWLDALTVTFDANGHGTAPVAQSVVSGGTATEPTAPRASGWAFDGWYKEASCTNAFDFSTAITASITLYAKWVELDCPTSGTVYSAKVSATTTQQFAASSEIEITEAQATVTGGSIWVLNGQTSEKNLIKAQSSHYYFCMTNNNTIFKLVLTCPLEAGDVITADCYASGDARGIWLSSDKDRPSEATLCSGTVTETGQAINYTVKEGDEYIEQTVLYVHRATSNSTYFDNINIVRSENCTAAPDAPSALVVSDITAYTALLTVTDADNTNNYEFYYATTSTAPTAETSATVTSNSKTVELTDLAPGTTYYAWVRSACDSYKSAWVAVTGTSFSTPSLAKYTITYNANGGTCGTITATQSAIGESLELPSATLAGYTLKGWYTAATGGELIGKAAETYSPTADITLYAQWTLEQNTYTADNTTDFPNPERGFYEHAEWSWTSEGDYDNNLSDSYFEKATDANRSLLLRIYYLDSDDLRANKALPDGFITMFNNDMDKIRSNGMKCILRFAYDKYTDEDGDEDYNDFEDASPETWATHLAQLKTHLQANADVIYTVQAGFLGVWGEWYYSSLGTGTAISESVKNNLITQLLDAVPANRCVQLRTPLFKTQYLDHTTALTAATAYKGTAQARLGHHNDAFLNGEENQGTYEDRTTDMAYIAQECLYVPIGGETNLTSDEDKYNTWCKGTIAEAEMAQLHYSYMNQGYSSFVTNKWKEEGAYERISRNLGYRFQLVNSVMDKEATAGTPMAVKLTIQNVGYAPLYNERYAYIVLKNSSNTYSIKLSSDPRTWAPNSATTVIEEEINLPATMAAGTYDLYLHLPDASAFIAANPKYAVRFANTDVWDETTGYNKLNAQVVVAATEQTIYTLTYANGGGTGTLPAAVSATEGENITLAENTLTREGYTFSGWTDGTNNYAAGATFVMPASDVTITAVWTEEITLDAGCFLTNSTTISGSNATMADGTIIALDNCTSSTDNISIGGNMLFTAPTGKYFTSFSFVATCGSDGKTNYYKINGGSKQSLASSTKTEQTYTITIPSGTNVSDIQIIKSGTTPKVTQICYTLTEVSVPTCTDPVVSTQPESQSILTGETTLLACAADKGTYQWYNATDNTAAGTGAAGTQVTTGSGYNAGGWTTPAFSTAGTYSYYCVITDGECSVQTNTVTISVTTAGGGGGDSYEYFVSEEDAAANSVTNSTIFIDAPTDGGNAEGDITFNGKNYTVTRRTSNTKHTITFDMPASWTKATLVLVHNQSGRNFTLKHPDETTVTGTNEENGDFRQNVFTITQSGTYTISNTENIGLIFIGLYPNSTAPTYEVTYDLADGTGTLPTQAATPEGGTFALASAEGLSKTGYSFAGWNDGTNTYSAGDTYTMPATDVTLTAQWACAMPTFSAQPASATYTVSATAAALAVTADAKGGTLTYQWQSSTDNVTFANISGATTSTYTPATDAEGMIYYRCVVTNTTSGCSASQTSDVATITTTTAPVSYTVTFDANGHGTAPAAQSVESGSTATEPTDPTETGFVFGGWYTESACINAFDFSTAITTNITLYAQWTEVSSGGEICVTFEGSSGANSYTEGNFAMYAADSDGRVNATNRWSTGVTDCSGSKVYAFSNNRFLVKVSVPISAIHFSAYSSSERTIKSVKTSTTAEKGSYSDASLLGETKIGSVDGCQEFKIQFADEIAADTYIWVELSNTMAISTICYTPAPTCTDPALTYATTTVDKSITDGKFTNPLTNSNSVTVTYSSDNTAVATVNETTGEVTIVGGGTATITASSATQTISSVEYCADEASYTLTVDDSGLLTPTFDWDYQSEMDAGGAYPISVSSDGGDVTLSITTTVTGVDLTSTSGNPATGSIVVSSCPSVLTITVQATSPSTATHRAHTEQKTINIILCQKVYNIPMSEPVYKDNGSGKPRYVCEVDGVGMLLRKLGTSTYDFGSGTNDVFEQYVSEKPFLVGTYLDNIFKIELYVNCGTKEKGVTVSHRDSYSSSEGDYDPITPTITYYTGNTVSEYMPKDEMGKVEILFNTPLDAGECVYIVCGATTKVYGAKLYRAEGDKETSVAFAGVGTINKFAGDEPFIQTATQTTAGIQSSGLITYSSSDETVATVDKNTGEVTPLSEGRTRIIATLAASGCYKSSSAEYTLIVKPCTDPECTIAVTAGAAKKCEGQTVTLTATAAEGATFQWYKDSVLIAGETNASIVINDPGYYYVEARKVCLQSSNSIRVINLSNPSVTALFDYYYIKEGRETPDLPLFKLENTSTYTVSYTPAGCSYELRDDDILYLVGTPGAIGDGTQTLTVTAENTCGGADASTSMTLHTLAATTKPSIAWIGCGDKGETLPGTIAASQSTEQALYQYLQTDFTLTPVNAYCTIDTKELRQYYSQFDLILLTDYPNSHECPGDVDKKDENSYSNAIGCLIDEKPILTFEAFVAGLPNWGINTTPGPQDPSEQTITLLCAAHNIFNHTEPVDETIQFVTSSGLQGFSGLEAPSGMIYIATIPDGSGGTRITCCERQTVIEARMMIMGLNNEAMGSVTDEGKIVIKQIIEYLLQIENIADCALVFDNKDGDHKWSNPKNWYPAYNAVPKPFQAVRIEQDCQVDNTAAHCSSIRLVKGQKENAGGVMTDYDAKLTILPNGGLTVTGFIKEVHDANFMTTYAIDPEDLIIQADENSNGTLVYGDEEQDLQATVEYYSSAYGAGTANPVWQYMGIPIINRPTAISQYHYSWMCSWENIGNVSSNWVWVENEDKVVPFKGYCITQAEEKRFEHKGTLSQPTKTSLSMAYFTSIDGDGFNMFANSWVAPIDITKMEVADFGGAAEATIFIYNTGSRAQYEADGITPSTDGTNTGAGQYNAIPVAASSYMAGALTKIPTMQGFFIKATKAGTLTLDYDRLCFNTSTFETTAEKMRAPQRVQDEDTTTEDVQPIVPQVMRLDVNSNTWGDRLYILTHNEFSDAFNMGWDGSKQMGDEAAPMLALPAPTGLLAVAAIDDANGRYLSFRAGKDSVYTFTFDYDGQPLYLYDQLEERAVEIKTGNTYTFTATNKTTTQRFLITDTPPLEIPTDISVVETGNSLHFENYNNELIQVRIVDMQGRVIYFLKTTDEIVDIVPNLPLGVYLAHITMGDEAKVVRLVGKEGAR